MRRATIGVILSSVEGPLAPGEGEGGTLVGGASGEGGCGGAGGRVALVKYRAHPGHRAREGNARGDEAPGT